MTDLIEDPAAQAVRRPPQSINSEQSILGGLMIDNNALDSIVDIIQPDDFYRRSVANDRMCQVMPAATASSDACAHGHASTTAKTQ